MALDPVTIAKIWMVVKPIQRIKERRAAKRAEREAAGLKPEVAMDSLKGAVKSRLVWLGFAQLAYGLFELWATGTLSVESAGPVISGAATIWLRVLTRESLAAKVQ